MPRPAISRSGSADKGSCGSVEVAGQKFASMNAAKAAVAEVARLCRGLTRDVCEQIARARQDVIGDLLRRDIPDSVKSEKVRNYNAVVRLLMERAGKDPKPFLLSPQPWTWFLGQNGHPG